MEKESTPLESEPELEEEEGWARHPVNRNRNRNRFFVPHLEIRTGKQDRTKKSRKSYRNTGQDFFYRNRTCKQGSIQVFIPNNILNLFGTNGVFLALFLVL